MHQGQITDLRIRVAELERIVDHLVGHLGVQVPAASSTVSAAVRQFVDAGQTHKAIQEYRRETGGTLKEAMLAIKALG
jgi:hypothetical protein